MHTILIYTEHSCKWIEISDRELTRNTEFDETQSVVQLSLDSYQMGTWTRVNISKSMLIRGIAGTCASIQ
jgi:hypothetical protein